MIPAIILSSHTMGLGVIRALGQMGVPIVNMFYDRNDMGYVSKYITEKVYVPHPEKSEAQFLDLLINYSKKLQHGILIPADDVALSVVSRNKGILENYYTVACSDWEITEQLIDKKNTYALAEKVGISLPKTLIPKSLDDLKKFGKDIGYPCLIKPSKSHLYFEIFHKKLVKVNNFEEMISAYTQATDAGIEVMLQEYIPGDDTNGVNYNAYFCEGRPLIEFTAEKVRLSPPQFGVPCIVISKNVPAVIEPGRKILQAAGYCGYACTEFKKDIRDGVYKLMEVNGRHNRSTLLSVRCGINFPWIEYRHLIHRELPKPHGYRYGIYWIDEFRDIYQLLKNRSKERYPFEQYLKPYLNEHIFAVFDMKDLKPFAKRCFGLATRSYKQC